MGAPSDDDLEDEATLLAAAGADADGDTSATPRCPACGRPTDDVSRMTDMQLLEELRSEFYRDLLRSMREGTATHQEKAIARGILRDNKVVADEEPSTKNSKTKRRPVETYDFTPNTLSETEGG